MPKKFNFGIQGEASDNVAKIFTAVMAIVLTGFGTYAWKNLDRNVQTLGAQIRYLDKRDTEKTLLFFQVKYGLDKAAESSKDQKVKSDLKSISIQIDQALKKWEGEDRERKLFAYPNDPPSSEAPVMPKE